MTLKQPSQERGAALLVALIMLLILTVLAVSGMRGVVLESRITGNRAESLRLQAAADAALREGEFRFYGPAYLRDKLEPSDSNCQKSNTLQTNGANRPCLLAIADEADRRSFMLDPLAFLASSSAENKTGHDTAAAGDTDVVTWMPYRGREAGNNNATSADFGAYWNTLLISVGEDDATALNAEYGAVMEGRGTYFYQINGQADDRLGLQSTSANVYVGLNN